MFYYIPQYQFHFVNEKRVRVPSLFTVVHTEIKMIDYINQVDGKRAISPLLLRVADNGNVNGLFTWEKIKETT